MNFEFNALKTYAAAQGYFTCYSAVSGATAGAIGYSIMSATGWTVQGIGYEQFIQSMTLGNTLLSIPFGICLLPSAYSRIGDWSYKSKNVFLTSVVISGLTGSCAGPTGSGIMGLLDSSEKISFVVATGATGAAVFASSIGVACCAVVACCFGVIYQGVVNKPGEITIDVEKQTTGMTLAFNMLRAEQKTDVNLPPEPEINPETSATNALKLAVV